MTAKQYIKWYIIFPQKYYIWSMLLGVITIYSIWKIRGKAKNATVIGMLVMYFFLVLSSTVLIRAPKTKCAYELLLFWSYVEIFKGRETLLYKNALNVLMLMPIGILLGIGFDMRKKHVFITGVIISLTIEVLQLLTKRGLFEFDDILHNSIGCLIGYVVCKNMKEKIIWGVR